MLQKFRQCAEDESGFTLIELLVVILIIGILTAIAIPPFLNQPSTASDAATKSQLDRAQRAEKTYATDHGTYTGKASDLRRIEPSLGSAPAVTPSLSATGYTLVATSTGPGGTTPVTYTLRVANGLTTHTCTPASTEVERSPWGLTGQAAWFCSAPDASSQVWRTSRGVR